ncbi:hypothetical protein AAFF_G00132600 [Aldrovandia affinis]|uniref:Uncharacterized protein n=1 Tax=Aldrovandia affinis TaxID=143900 RepID=A0AAD7RQE6_9TELE|nr:hypothetical protein AAFF_G00132600 [Aldrovandia affinis]
MCRQGESSHFRASVKRRVFAKRVVSRVEVICGSILTLRGPGPLEATSGFPVVDLRGNAAVHCGHGRAELAKFWL